MKTIYIVTWGCYSDYSIHSVWTKREDAEAIVKQIESNGGRGDEPRVETYQVDSVNPTCLHPLWKVQMKRDGSVMEIRKIDHPSSGTAVTEAAIVVGCGMWVGQPRRELAYCFNIVAADEKHAVKIANERRAWMLANNLW